MLILISGGMDHTLLLTKLARVARTQCDSDLEQFRSSWVAFELVCALEKSEELQRQVYLWPDVDSDIKDKLCLPQEDIGIDYMDKECSFAGQAKCYISTTRVSTKDIDRTRFCMYRGSRYAKEDILQRCEVATPEGVSLGRCKASMDDVDHKIITSEVIEKWYERSMEVTLVEEDNLQIQEEGYLRECQVKALENILPGRVNKIKLACGSGKTKVAVEVIARKSGAYLVLVPYITLLEQWGAYLKQFDFKVYMVGTGYELPEKVTRKLSETVVIVSVYDSYEKAIYLEREGRVMYRTFECVFVDEAHHIDEREDNRSGEIWKFINRKDKMAVMLSASLGEDADYNYTLRNAIDDKICCDYDVRVAYFDVLPTMESIAKYISENTEYLSILAYCNSIKSARLLAEECKKRGVTAESLSCNESRVKRKRIIGEFENGKFRVLVSVNTLGEGINLRCADTCLFAEPRGSAVSIVQCIGRVVRQYKGKEMAHVVVCTNIDREEKISGHPVVKILRALAKEDPMFVKKATNKKDESSKMRNECVREEENNEMYKERAFWLKDEIYGRIMDYILEGNWEFSFEELKNYKEKNNSFPPTSTKIGAWLRTQRNMARNKKLSFTRKEMLDKGFGEKIWLPNLPVWKERFEELKVYKKENNKFPPASTKIGSWLKDQKALFRNNKLYLERAKYLHEEFGDEWLYNPVEKQWYDTFEKLKKYYKVNNRFPRQKEPMGSWLYSQRMRKKGKGAKLSNNQIKIMEDTFPDWMNTYKSEKIWYGKLNELKSFYETNKRFPKAKESQLGTWLASQRSKNIKNILTEKQKDTFAKLLPNWADTQFSENVWYEKLEKVRIFRDGHGRYPCVSDGDLGIWLSNLRSALREKGNKKKLTEQQKDAVLDRFPDIHSTYQSEEVWYQNLNNVKKYYETYNYLPKTKDGQLGFWLGTQRCKNNKGLLSENQKISLDKSLPDWEGREHEWCEKIDKIREIFVRTCSFPVSNEPLGRWLSKQRLNLNKPGFSQERKQKLDEMLPGWIKFDRVDERWYKNLEKTKIYYLDNKKLPTRTSDNSLSRWIETQRAKIKGTVKCRPLTPQQKSLLDKTFPGWVSE